MDAGQCPSLPRAERTPGQGQDARKEGHQAQLGTLSTIPEGPGWSGSLVPEAA